MPEKKKFSDKILNKKFLTSAAIILLTVLLVAFWCVLAFIQVNKTESGSWNEREGTEFIAHRGYSDKYFQNTVQAFEAAGKEKFFQGIETDVRMTKDGVFVCSHDDNPFVDNSVFISKSDYKDIKDLPLDVSKEKADIDKAQEYRIATVKEYLYVCLENRKKAFIELKVDFEEAEAKRIFNEVNSVLNYNRYVFCSFYKGVLDRIYDYKTYASIQLFTADSTNAFFYTKMGYNICVNKKLLKNDGRVKRAHKNNVWIGAYTVNDAAEAAKLVAMGVDFITCDRVLEL